MENRDHDLRRREYSRGRGRSGSPAGRSYDAARKNGTDRELRQRIQEMDHRGYPAYKSLAGTWRMQRERYNLVIDHVQGDPFASPSSVHVEISGAEAGFPKEAYAEKHRRIALEDHLTRLFAGEASGHSRRSGSGKSGAIFFSRPGQEILERTACHVDSSDGKVVFRFRIGFPAHGRSIDASAMIRLVFQDVPEIVQASLFYANIDQRALRRVLELADDQRALRESLAENHWTAFIADGSVLPRESGVSQRPMRDAVPFRSPESLRKTVVLPHRGEVAGMGIPEGITLIIGGGYHGKSTLLSALTLGVYDHVAGDGRELAAADRTAVKVRAEDGRSVKQDDISMFIHNLPNGADSSAFSTENASGSTSQAAGIVEAMEAGTRTLLIDEDTSATNLMMRDELMERAVPDAEEPITPLIDRISEIRDEMGISTVLVAGSFGAYFEKADTVLRLDHYHVQDITGSVRQIVEENHLHRASVKWAGAPSFRRIPEKSRLFDDDRMKLRSSGMEEFSVNHESVDLRLVEQIADPEQTAALARCLVYLETHCFRNGKTLAEAADQICGILEKDGFAGILGGIRAVPELAMPRRQEILAAVNRFRGLKLR